MEKVAPILFESKSDCCACGACENVCPKNAIAMREDERGFLFPTIDSTRCVGCGACVKVCPLKSAAAETARPDVYAVKTKNAAELSRSASGGAFAAMARRVLESGGVVVGCALNENVLPTHIRIDSVDELSKLQGSKYVQSDVGLVFRETKEALKSGRTVLFSGTPCQCDGLRSYLGRDYDNLLCVELICHGVPSAAFFRAYLDLLEKRWNVKIVDVAFRDKKRGWGALLRFDCVDARGRAKRKYLSVGESYYYFYFYWGENICRESCYRCPYANPNRKSDYTIGDYWGVQRAHPEIDATNGVSVLLANTEKGKARLAEFADYMELVESNFEDASRENGQLLAPTSKSANADELWDAYLAGGAERLDREYRKRCGKAILKGKIKRSIPLPLKKWLKKAARLGFAK